MKNKLFTLCFFIALLCAVFAGADEVSTPATTSATVAGDSTAGPEGTITNNSVAPEASVARNSVAPEVSVTRNSVAPEVNAPAQATSEVSTVAPEVPADSTPYGLPKELLPLWDSLTIKQKAAQMVMVYFSPAKFLIENEFGAVLVMKNHLKDVDSFKEKLQAANDGLRIPLLVATDQEGGRVNRLGNISEQWKDAPSAKEMRDMPDDSIAYIAQSIGAELHALGINLNLAPVLDPAKDHRGKNSFIEESKRSWDKDSTSAEKVRAFVKGMRESGVTCVSKHFPGYDSWTNSDHQIAISSSPKKKMTENYHFFLGLAEDIPVTMMSSVRFVRVSSRPAVFEPKIVRMARKMSPDMVILTDDLWGVSLRAWISGTERITSKNYPRKDFRKLILTALNAGNDMFMITYPAKAVEMVKYLEQLAKNNKKYKTRIEESAARILKLKYNAGLLQ